MPPECQATCAEKSVETDSTIAGSGGRCLVCQRCRKFSKKFARWAVRPFVLVRRPGVLR